MASDERLSVAEPELGLDILARTVIGAAIEVHRRLGPGLDETLYEQALTIELSFQQIAFARQVVFPVHYRDQLIGEKRLDLVVGGRLIVELKAVDQLAPVHTAQVLTYLRVTGQKLGLLINFNSRILKDGIKRVVQS